MKDFHIDATVVACVPNPDLMVEDHQLIDPPRDVELEVMPHEGTDRVMLTVETPITLPDGTSIPMNLTIHLSLTELMAMTLRGARLVE
jgi:hypothetical protein